MEHYPVTEEQIRFYEENGYAQFSNVLDDAEIAQLRESIAVAVADLEKEKANWGPRTDDGYAKVFLQMVNLWERYPAIKKYSLNEKVAELARRLTRAPYVRLWHDQALIKYPKDSKPTVWHQDKVYWPMNESGGLSCWMALDDVTVANGCMFFVPGSHKLGSLNPIDLGNADEEALLRLVPESQRKNFKPTPVEMKAGSCTFHNGLTFHYAGPNITAAPRRAMVTIYLPAGTTYRTHPHMIGDRAGLQPGQEFDHPLFPIVAGKPGRV
jgi:phytanoyl-CoA hydroxylase